MLKRVHSYTKKHYPEYSLEEELERAYFHIKEKFGRDGYAKMYIKDGEYQVFLEKIDILLRDKEFFSKKYQEINEISRRKIYKLIKSS